MNPNNHSKEVDTEPLVDSHDGSIIASIVNPEPAIKKPTKHDVEAEKDALVFIGSFFYYDKLLYFSLDGFSEFISPLKILATMLYKNYGTEAKEIITFTFSETHKKRLVESSMRVEKGQVKELNDKERKELLGLLDKLSTQKIYTFENPLLV
jgi:hypothetical protein